MICLALLVRIGPASLFASARCILSQPRHSGIFCTFASLLVLSLNVNILMILGSFTSGVVVSVPFPWLFSQSLSVFFALLRASCLLLSFIRHSLSLCCAHSAFCAYFLATSCMFRSQSLFCCTLPENLSNWLGGTIHHSRTF